jgi:H+/gluconate symporter-like permease
MIEISGFAKALAAGITHVAGPHRAMFGIVVICALMVYGGVSVFVVGFAVYPFAAELFREAAIPKRLVPATMSLGTFTFAMDALPGSPQIQNIIPTTFFGTTTMAAPILGPIGGLFILVVGMAYLDWRRRLAAHSNEGYGTGHLNEPDVVDPHALVSPVLASLPLAVVAAANIGFTSMIPKWYGTTATLALTPAAKPIAIEVSRQVGVWAVEAALLLGILTVAAFAWRRMIPTFVKASHAALAGCLLASMNTASEFGFGAVMAALPGFDSEPARQRGDHGDDAGRRHRIGVRRAEPGAGGDGRTVQDGGAGRAHSVRGAAPGVGDGGGRHGHAAAQRRDHHAAGNYGADASSVLWRYFRDYLYQDDGRVRRDRCLLPYRDRLEFT